MLCLFEQDFLKYYTKAGMDTEELEVCVQVQKHPPPKSSLLFKSHPDQMSPFVLRAESGGSDVFCS